jgi:hypothetical protein
VLPNVGPYIYIYIYIYTLKILALQGAPCIHDISRIRDNYAAHLVSSPTALAFVTAAVLKCKSTLPCAMEINNWRKTAGTGEKLDAKKLT